jgi:hypothetical protein
VHDRLQILAQYGKKISCPDRAGARAVEGEMTKFLLWLILLVLCWPLAILALILYPIVWLLLLPFRLLGMTVNAAFELLRALIGLPARVLRGPGR